MGRAATAVIDERLRVRGIENLRVIDCSSIPFLPSGNTNAPVMALAWRAADLIEQEGCSRQSAPVLAQAS
jgi:choline dehydrogenase-like flavoprotein